MKFATRALAVLFLSASGSLPAQAPQQVPAAALNAYIDGLQRQGTFNGNILVVDHGKVVLERTVGKADAAGTAQLDAADRFQIGSIAKEFDAVGLLMLKEQGKLALSDPLSRFFPELPPWAATITVDELLHYTSGLPQPNFKLIHSDADNWKALQAVNHLNFTPGSQYSYNNNDVFLRRRIIEKVSGLSFAGFLEKHEFPVAHLRHAVIDPGDDTLHVAKAFSTDGKQDRLVAPISGWVALTLGDLLQWSKCIETFCLIGPESTRLIAHTDEPERQSGFGTLEMRGNNVTNHVHDGTLLHYRALLLSRPGIGRAIIILSNQRPPDIYAMAAAIDQILSAS